MKLENLGNWLQISASIGIVIGLVLVIWELRQSQDIARAQMVDSTFGHIADLDIAELGEEPAPIQAKACEQPKELTRADLIVLDAFFVGTLDRFRRQIHISRRSDFYDDENWRNFPFHYYTIFETHAGRSWWMIVRPRLLRNEPELVEAGDEILSSLGEPACAKRLESYRNYLNQSSQQYGL